MGKLLLMATVACLALAQVAMASMTSNTVKSTAELSQQGTRAEVGVLLRCDEPQRASLRVTLTQRSADGRAVADGKRSVDCTTATRTFAVKAEAREDDRFEDGKATACVLAVTKDDVRQWCKEISLD